MRLPAAVCGLLACAAFCAAPAGAETTALAELPHPDSRPAGITVAPDGNVWFTELDGLPGGTGRIGRLTPDGDLTEFALLSAGSAPTSIVAGPDGNLWFTESGIDKIGRITPDGVITEFGGLVAGAAPQDITVGPDAALWFTEGGYNRGNRIGRIDPISGTVSEFCIRGCGHPVVYSDAGLHPAQIATGPDGRLWFTESNPDRGDDGTDYGDQGTGYIGAITTAGTVSEYPVPTFNAQPRGIVAGPDGNLWFTEYGDPGNRVAYVTLGGEVKELGELPTTASRPGRIIAPGDGNLWLAEGVGNRLASISPAGEGIELDPLSGEDGPGVYPVGLAVDADGTLWITQMRGNRLARTTVTLPQKATTTAPAPTAAPAPAPSSASHNALAKAARAALSRMLATIAGRVRATGSARLARRGGLDLVLRAPAAGHLTVELIARPRGRNVVLAKLSNTYRTAGSARVRLVLTKAGRRLLKRRPGLRATLKATFVAADGQPVTTTRRLVLSAAARRAPSRSAG